MVSTFGGKVVAALTSKAVSAKIKGEPGHFADGNGLYLVVPGRGRSYWALRFTSNGKRKQMTLGSVDDLSLADARVAAALKMKQLREGLDPLVAKKEPSTALAPSPASMTFSTTGMKAISSA